MKNIGKGDILSVSDQEFANSVNNDPYAMRKVDAVQGVESANYGTTRTTIDEEVPRLTIKRIGVNHFVEAPADLEWAHSVRLEGLFHCDRGYFLVQFDRDIPGEIIHHSDNFMDMEQVVEWCIRAGAKVPDDVMEEFIEKYSDSE